MLTSKILLNINDVNTTHKSIQTVARVVLRLIRILLENSDIMDPQSSSLKPKSVCIKVYDREGKQLCVGLVSVVSIVDIRSQRSGRFILITKYLSCVV